MKRQRWKVKNILGQGRDISTKFNINPLLADIVLSRGIDENQVISFLHASLEDLHPPKLLPDIFKAKKRIKQAVSKKENVMVLGDYDVDGITSLAIFHEFSKRYSGIFSFYIPDRVKEGYGLSKEVVDSAKKEKKDLIIAFDCGINSSSEIEYAKALGIDVVVVDHHLPQHKLPKPVALVNPKIKKSNYPFIDLPAAALSFKLVQILKEDDCYQLLDLVALAIVCDVTPLLGENRILLKEGIKILRKTSRPAVKALCKIAKIKQENISNFHIGYILGPRINASGRIAHAKDALKLFLTDDLKEACQFAETLNKYNILRKNVEKQILKEAESKIESDLCREHALVVGGSGWHPGVLGIVASRLKDRYSRPSFVVSLNKGIAKGSGRSTEAVHLMDMLHKCSSSLTAYGGHKKAVGMQLEEKNLDIFRENINLAIRENVDLKDFIPVLEIDSKLEFRQITADFINGLNLLYPHGEANPKPIFLSKGVRKRKDIQRLRGRYLLWLTDGERTFETILYSKDLAEIIKYGKEFDIVFSLDKNNYSNYPQLVLRDCRLA
ncbi:MAG: single-stranded-DNA-specific exonuclease RecJ [Candidatus Omnitrophica bacterium]|nr:single-stranded-DNA-specific exonuclease RecJ [Candidatus Omnitrophota bacterium]MCF7877163.1 single-stranded-DNA-specific exonuclease RecJ [Candidatus Omnitrophota bacterium]MCF7878410.1 single-stranded-DNA-specific exonuclease RecJ [Candidatus Omnitrophota bacterium]MCF7892865.1 single-stranded-DNA-specific exonuclease RecJ [Candidatus Omnitrophota bacterium]